jgi:hypothetical protein
MTDCLVYVQRDVSHVETELADLFALRTELLCLLPTLFNLHLNLDIFLFNIFWSHRDRSLYGVDSDFRFINPSTSLQGLILYTLPHAARRPNAHPPQRVLW